MQVLIALSKKIDGLNEKIGSAVSWALLLAVLICTGNALIRYSFNNSSNGWLEIQWYLFGAVFLLAAPYTLRRNEHVRIDVIAGRFSKRTQVWIDLLGYVFFLMPMAILILYLGTPYAIHSFTRQEMSSNAGGLIEWPAKLLIPLGFALLVLQGISEIIKRIGYLRGLVDASEFDKQAKTAQDEIDAIKLANQDKLARHEFGEQK
jgi:TRAP-type mannitol/chloroaromatic compound transport system permease small subunit